MKALKTIANCCYTVTFKNDNSYVMGIDNAINDLAAQGFSIEKDGIITPYRFRTICQWFGKIL